MSLIDLKVADAQEFVAVSAGEYELTVISAELSESKKTPGNMGLALAFTVEGEPLAQVVREWINLPSPNDDERIANSRLLRLKQFCTTFGYDPSAGIETDDLPGLSGHVILKVESSDEYGDQNRIQRFLS